MTFQNAAGHTRSSRKVFASRHLAAVGIGAVALFAATTSIAQDVPRYCEVALEFSLDGRTIGTPSALVEFGQQADVTIGDEMHGWHFSIVADEPKIVRRVNAIPIEIDLYEVLRGEQILRASPHFAVAPGQRADLDTIFASDGREAHVGLVANLKSDVDVQAMRHDGGSDAN